MSRWVGKWHRKQERMKHSLRDTYVYRIIGDCIFDRRLWKIDMNSFSAGLSLGLFVAFTPTIPFQMLLCTIGAILFHVNLPVSLVACWITNPLTALPIYASAYWLGANLLQKSQWFEFVLELFDLETRSGRFIEQSFYLWTGSLIFSIAAALVGYIAPRYVWRLKRWIKIS